MFLVGVSVVVAAGPYFSVLHEDGSGAAVDGIIFVHYDEVYPHKLIGDEIIKKCRGVAGRST